MGDMDELKERVVAIETRCPLREEVVNNQFQFVAKKLDETISIIKDKNGKIDEMYSVINNGLKDSVRRHEESMKSLEERINQTDKMLSSHTVALQSMNKKPSGRVANAAHNMKEWTIKITIPVILLLYVLKALGIDVDMGFIEPLLKSFIGLPN
jgi:methyl-accepting chemotaxis protein